MKSLLVTLFTCFLPVHRLPFGFVTGSLCYAKEKFNEVPFCLDLLLFPLPWATDLRKTLLEFMSENVLLNVLFEKSCSASCPLSQWGHPTVTSSVTPFSSCPQSFPASGLFPMSQLFTSGGKSFGASASVLSMNIQGDFLEDWLVWSLCCPGTLNSLLQHHNSKFFIT